MHEVQMWLNIEERRGGANILNRSLFHSICFHFSALTSSSSLLSSWSSLLSSAAASSSSWMSSWSLQRKQKSVFETKKLQLKPQLDVACHLIIIYCISLICIINNRLAIFFINLWHFLLSMIASTVNPEWSSSLSSSEEHCHQEATDQKIPV